MTIHHKLAVIGAITATLGVISLTPVAISWVAAQSANNLPPASISKSSTTSTLPVDVPLITGKPVRLEVAAAGINIAIIDGTYNQNNGQWTLSQDKAHFALPTSMPNNKSGNTLVYGHNTPQVFGTLHKAPIGTTAKVFTDNGHVLTYTLRASQKVNPNDTSIFEYQGAPQLTLQTCTGVWSEARQFFYFDLTTTQ